MQTFSVPPGLSGVILCPTGLVSGTTASSSPQAGHPSSSSLKGRQAAPGMRGRAVATGRSGASRSGARTPAPSPPGCQGGQGGQWCDNAQFTARLTSGHASAGPAAGHLAPAIGKGQAGRPGPISHEPERGAEGSGLPSTQVDLGVAALLARLPNPGLGKPACIWQPSTRPSGSPCLARLGRRSDVTPCYASITVHNLFRRAGTTHHGEDHPTRDPWSG